MEIRKFLYGGISGEDIKNGANLIGGYFLKGLGAFGKLVTSPFVQLGPTSATIYKSKDLLAKERTILNKSEQLLGNAMTWISPLNYGVALTTGNGLNARKGEQKIASWAPAWQAIGRVAELYAGPKIVKRFVPKKPKGSSNELYTLRDNTGGNSKITMPDVYRSLADAVKYKSSKGYMELVNRAKKEAEEMGLPFSSDLYIGVNKSIPSIKLNPRPEGRVGGYRKVTNTIELDPDQLSPLEAKYVPFHEGLHWQKVGTPELNSPLYNRWKLNMRDELAWNDFYHSEEHNKLKYEDNARAYARNKIKEALYEDADPYLSIPGELLANGLEAGKAIGLEPFAEYPGYGKALEASKKARNYNSWLWDVKAGTTLEMLNFWKILTGNYIPAASIPLIFSRNE